MSLCSSDEMIIKEAISQKVNLVFKVVLFWASLVLFRYWDGKSIIPVRDWELEGVGGRFSKGSTRAGGSAACNVQLLALRLSTSAASN